MGLLVIFFFFLIGKGGASIETEMDIESVPQLRDSHTKSLSPMVASQEERTKQMGIRRSDSVCM